MQKTEAKANKTKTNLIKCDNLRKLQSTTKSNKSRILKKIKIK